MTVSIDKKPSQLNLYNAVRHTHGSKDKHQQQSQMMPMGFPPMIGAPSPFYTGGFMDPWAIQRVMMSQGLTGLGPNNSMSSPICRL
jgi:hypothetical protein